ncbi:hypothetical protein ES703_41839 [subsurface metagenome]
MVRSFRWLEYAIAILIATLLAWALIQALDSITPRIYDYSSEKDLVDALKEGYESGQITYAEMQEMLEIYREAQLRFRLERWRIRLLYALSICVSALLFRKYRLLRFRERPKDYFSADKA